MLNYLFFSCIIYPQEEILTFFIRGIQNIEFGEDALISFEDEDTNNYRLPSYEERNRKLHKKRKYKQKEQECQDERKEQFRTIYIPEYKAGRDRAGYRDRKDLLSAP